MNEATYKKMRISGCWYEAYRALKLLMDEYGGTEAEDMIDAIQLQLSQAQESIEQNRRVQAILNKTP